jgi:hypothetical protein
MIRSRTALLLFALTGCGDGASPAIVDGDHPYSIPVGQFRYLESALPYISWLEDQGLPPWVVGVRDFDEGTWYQVHVGAAADPEQLASLREALVELGYGGTGTADFHSYADRAFFDMSSYLLWTYDPDRTIAQLGPRLSTVAAAFPCHPRFALEAFHGGYALEVEREHIRHQLHAEGLHDIVLELANAPASTPPLTGWAAYRDLPSGVRLSVSMVERDPLPESIDLGKPTERFEGPGWTWLARPIAEPGTFEDGQEVIYLLWTEERDRIALVASDDPHGYALASELFDRRHCSAGAFQFASLWRPLGILPRQFDAQDVPVAVETSILGQEYVDMKGGAAWARKMKGRWTFSNTYMVEGEDHWAVQVFDLETSQAAEECHGKLYSSQMWNAYNSYGNELAQAWGWDALYTTSIRGVRAWYVDHYQRDQTKELNFHTGPFIFAMISFVSDPDPLLMDDLVDRAKRLPMLGGEEGW